MLESGWQQVSGHNQSDAQVASSVPLSAALRQRTKTAQFKNDWSEARDRLRLSGMSSVPLARAKCVQPHITL